MKFKAESIMRGVLSLSLAIAVCLPDSGAAEKTGTAFLSVPAYAGEREKTEAVAAPETGDATRRVAQKTAAPGSEASAGRAVQRTVAVTKAESATERVTQKPAALPDSETATEQPAPAVTAPATNPETETTVPATNPESETNTPAEKPGNETTAPAEKPGNETTASAENPETETTAPAAKPGGGATAAVTEKEKPDLKPGQENSSGKKKHQKKRAKIKLRISKASPVKSKVIVLDPGHCPVHAGTYNYGLREDAVALDIALACRDALDNYADVTVYMTRDDGTCCEALGLGDCLGARSRFAKRLSADALVSFHGNAVPGGQNASGTHGANVLAAYSSGYHDKIRRITQSLGKTILSRLKSIGLADRGLLLRKSDNGSRYEDGSLMDYYSIVRHGVRDRIPGVIIEHGYMTNPYDSSHFFRTHSQRAALGKADAAAIAQYFGISKKPVSGHIKKKKNAAYFVDKNGRKVGGWVKTGGKWYYFDKTTGRMAKGFLTLGKDSFYLDPSTGAMTGGRFNKGGGRYLARGNGRLVKNRAYDDGNGVFLFDDKGRQYKKGVHEAGGGTYHVNAKTGTVDMNKIIGKRRKYFYAETGERKTGWIRYGGCKYYFDPETGKMVTGRVKIGKKTYVFSKKNGRLKRKK